MNFEKYLNIEVLYWCVFASMDGNTAETTYGIIFIGYNYALQPNNDEK